MDNQQKIDGTMEALRTVIDPEIGMNVIELGLVRDVQISDDSVHVMMIMTTPFCPYAPQLLEQTRRTAQDFLGTPTTIEMGMEMHDLAGKLGELDYYEVLFSKAYGDSYVTKERILDAIQEFINSFISADSKFDGIFEF